MANAHVILTHALASSVLYHYTYNYGKGRCTVAFFVHDAHSVDAKLKNVTAAIAWFLDLRTDKVNAIRTEASAGVEMIADNLSNRLHVDVELVDMRKI